MKDPNFKSDFSRHFQGGNKEATIDVGAFASQFGLQNTMLNLFEKDGVTCFSFTLSVNARKFECNFALRPEVHNEDDVRELAEDVWSRRQKTLRRVFGGITR